jgi:hypothetical protein
MQESDSNPTDFSAKLRKAEEMTSRKRKCLNRFSKCLIAVSLVMLTLLAWAKLTGPHVD